MGNWPHAGQWHDMEDHQSVDLAGESGVLLSPDKKELEGWLGSVTCPTVMAA